MDFQSIIKNLKDDQLEDLRREVTEAAEARRRDASLGWINPAMTAEDKDRAWRDVQALLRENGR